MTLKVTFDTNVFQRFINLQEDKEKIYYEKILRVIKSNIITGYFSDTFITLEGIQRINRAEIIGSRKISSSSSTSSNSTNTINIAVGASMRESHLHDEHLSIVISLIELGIKGLRGPLYLGDNFLVKPDINIYEAIPIDTLRAYREKMEIVERAIGKRNMAIGGNVSKCRARDLGLNWLTRDHRDGEIWYQGLGLAKNPTESKQVVKAIAEWADGESIIRHIGYGNDYFCTSDQGKGTKGASIFDDAHRKWLTSEFGVQFVTPQELIEIISI
jgi:hypothetical protein